MSSISFFKNVDFGLSDAVIYKKYMMVSQWHMYTQSLCHFWLTAFRILEIS